ncbi:MAG TPA: condensation domain-containing protein, partial [Verrucomicrobiae bacterium]|nr:condensation domain-containing protein [Verrucomicrobiae bacterium]
ASFAHSQRERLQGAVLEKQLEFWRQQLSGAQTTLDLPADRPRPAIQTFHGATKCFALSGKLSTELSRLSRKEGATLFMVLLAAFQTLLHRYTNQEDILVGAPAAGRMGVGTENLIGFFLNTLVLRGDLSGGPTFRGLLKQIRRVALDAYAHQELPFEKLVDALQPARDLSRSPLFQAMFVLQNEPLRPLELAGLKLKPLHVHSGTAKFDLMLSLEESGGNLNGFAEYNADLFDESTMARMLENFQTLLEGIVADPGRRLSQLPLLAEAERNQILSGWNNTAAEFPKDKCIHRLFEKQAERTPDAVALVFEDERLTYRELDGRTDELAHELQSLGVGPDVRVGVCVRRSLEMMVGLLGILKAGGCYVPLDPAYPKERSAFMLEDAQMPVLLTQEKLADGFKRENPKLKVICLDAPRSAPPAKPLATRPESGAKPENLAYVIYTSGSTGKPKGVMVTHRNVLNFFAGMDRMLGTKPGVWLAVTSISFDISVLELFWTLARGFRVVVQPDDDRSAPAIARGGGDSTNDQWRPVPEQI